MIISHPIMNFKKIEKKILKWLGISLGVLGLVLFIFHLWLVNHAEKIIEELVDKESKGKLKLKLGNLKFSYFSKNLDLQNLSLYSTDSLSTGTSYHFSIAHINLKVNEIFPVIFKKQLLIDSFSLLEPQIEISRVQSNNDSSFNELNNISVPEELGKIYNSIQNALNALHVNRFQIEEGKLVLHNRTKLDELPLTITNLHFHIDNLNVDSTSYSVENKFLFSDNIVLRSRNQDIIFPDGAHRLAFSRFRVNLRKKVFEIDSCTISEIKKENTNPAFSVFFDTLKITSVDFKILAENKTLVADSVFCINPVVKLTLQEKLKLKNKMDLPDIARIIQQFTGNMHLNYVGVSNAGLHLALIQNGKTNTFSSNQTNFEIKGLQIDTLLTNPFKLESFAMAIRNQEIKLSDAGYIVHFDSILFNQNRLLLNNFYATKKLPKSFYEFRVKSVQLSGLSWKDLLFRNELIAESASLLNPVINFTDTTLGNRRRTNSTIFSAFHTIHEILNVKKIQIYNGTVTGNLTNNFKLWLNHLNLNIAPNYFFSSQNSIDLQKAITQLSFQNGKISNSEYELQLENADFSGKLNTLKANRFHFLNAKKTIELSANNITLGNFLESSVGSNFSLDYLSWQKGAISLRLNNEKISKKETGIKFKLNKLTLSNTNLKIEKNETLIETSLERINAGPTTIDMPGNLSIEAANFAGYNLKITNTKISLVASNYNIADNSSSFIENIKIHKLSEKDSFRLFIPKLEMNPDINQALKGKIKLTTAVFTSPQIEYTNRFFSNDSLAQSEINILPIDIDEIKISEPQLSFSILNRDNKIEAAWVNDAKKQSNQIIIKKFVSSDRNKFAADQIQLNANGISFRNSASNKINSNNSQLNLTIQNFSVAKNAGWSWKGMIQDLRVLNFSIDSFGKNKNNLLVSSFSVTKMNLSSANYKIPEKILNESPLLGVADFTGEINNSSTFFKWNNFTYNHQKESFSIDSVVVYPKQDQETFIALQKFQKEYVTLKTGQINISGFNPADYLKDSVVKAGTISINNSNINIYHDKRLPFNKEISKPLPTKLIKDLPFRVSIDTVKYENMNLVYTELNDLTMQTGIVPVHKMYGMIFPIRNIGLKPSDTLNIRMNGYLLDSLWLRLRIRESYSDSLAGFFITLRMRPGSLSGFNNFLPQLSSLKIRNGMLDTISMRAVGMEYFSFGEIKAFYHNLKLEFLKNDLETKKIFLRGLITFIATNFIIKKENKSRTGRVFVSRLRERSIINYILKMTLSGLASSAGAKNKKKMLKKYKKELLLRNLPPLDYD
jgi:hypothetical protein